MKTKIKILSILVIFLFLIMPLHAGTTSPYIAVSYGETTYENGNDKAIVDNFFKEYVGMDPQTLPNNIITASDVNQISKGISGKTYNKNQIVSCALVDLSSNDDIEVYVDPDYITTVTPTMYESALNSAGIYHGDVYVTSPERATGESALAGVMQAYELATGKQIPSNVKAAANNEIQVETNIINENNNVNSEEISNLIIVVKQEVKNQNINNEIDIENLVINTANEKNVDITQDQAKEIAKSILETQNVQEDANQYSQEIQEVTQNNDNSQSNSTTQSTQNNTNQTTSTNNENHVNNLFESIGL
ncbi:MAG: DUF1002 domain-containing protein [Methanobacteriaceae archaeon]|nr:DUF1002 domain-containing protein [Methanobacteriaceae archaeon]